MAMVWVGVLLALSVRHHGGFTTDKPKVRKMTVTVLGVVVLIVSTAGSVSAGQIRVDRSPHKFTVRSEQRCTATVGLLALGALQDVSVNGIRIANRLPQGSSLTIRPDGTAVFAYSDLFLRNFQGREQVVNGKDFHGRPAEDFLRFPATAKPPKFLQDIWKVDATHLCMNTVEDILWWTGELTYRFDFAFPVRAFRLQSPDGKKTQVGDWEWEKVGRAVKIFASTDGEKWTLIWQSHGSGGVTAVDAELPERFKGARTVFLKFWGQNHNVLFDLFVSAELDATDAMDITRLERGDNSFVFRDGVESAHKALIFFKGTGVRVVQPERRVGYPGREPSVSVSGNEIAILFPQRVGVWLATEGKEVIGIKRVTVEQEEVLSTSEGAAVPPVASAIKGGKIEPVRDWAAYLTQRDRERGTSYAFPKRGGLSIEKMPLKGKFAGWERQGEWICISVRLSSGYAQWFFAPASVRIGSAVWKGIRWKLRLRGLGRVFQVTVSEPVAFSVGDWRLAQVWGPFEEHRLILGEFNLPPRGYFAWQQPFFFLAGDRGATLGFFEAPVYAVVSETQETDRLIVRSEIPVRGDEVIDTPAKVWLFRSKDFSSKWDAINEWTQCFDYLANRYRLQKGIKEVEPKPTLLWQHGWQVRLWGKDYYAAAKEGLPQQERWFYRLANEIPRLAQWGIRVVYVSGAIESDADKTKADWLPGSLCFGSVCAPCRLEVSPCMGGEQGLKHLCDIAHRHGVKIVLWSTPAHLSNSSPLLYEHPEWLAWRADGEPEHFGYGDITGVNLRRGYFDYAIRQYQTIRRTTGFDGVWQDSFLTFGILTDFSEMRPYPQLDETVEMQRDCRRWDVVRFTLKAVVRSGCRAAATGRAVQNISSASRGGSMGFTTMSPTRVSSPRVTSVRLRARVLLG